MTKNDSLSYSKLAEFQASLPEDKQTEFKSLINILKLQAIRLACQVSLPLIDSHHVQLLSDNMMDLFI